MTYLEKNNIDEAIRKNLRKKDVYKSDMQKIYNLIVVQTNKKLQEKSALEATFPTRAYLSLPLASSPSVFCLFVVPPSSAGCHPPSAHT